MAPAKKNATASSSKDNKSKDSKGKDNKNKSKESGKDESKDKNDKKLKPATAINVRHILCEKHSRKEEALTKLREGSKFDEVAREFSEDKARQGGSLGWKTRGSLIAEFEAVAYGLQVSTTGSPAWGEVKTSEGYHIMMVEGRR